MRTPVALSDSEVAAEVTRLCAEVRQARREARRITRDVAAAAGINLGSLHRIEQAEIRPAYRTFAGLAEALGKRLELDDGADRPRGLPRDAVALPEPGDFVWFPIVSGSPRAYQELRYFYRLFGMGQELWWARRRQLEKYLTDDAMCELLAISHHTLRSVEFGPRLESKKRGLEGSPTDAAVVGWPRLASMVRVAALTGRRLVLVDEALLQRLPPWDWRTGSLDVMPDAARLPDMED